MLKQDKLGKLFCRTVRSLLDDENQAWTCNICEDCPNGITAHIKKKHVFEGSPIHSLSPKCEGLEY